ncbi:hypothetical protein ACJX0J_019173, partial [Zea mays]
FQNNVDLQLVEMHPHDQEKKSVIVLLPGDAGACTWFTLLLGNSCTPLQFFFGLDREVLHIKLRKAYWLWACGYEEKHM